MCDGWDRGRLVGAFICFRDARSREADKSYNHILV